MIELTHANKAVKVYIPIVTGFYFDNVLNATLVFGMGNTVFPVKESPEEVKELLTKTSKGET